MTYNELLLKLLAKLEEKPELKDKPVHVVGTWFEPRLISSIDAAVIQDTSYVLFLT